MGHDDDDNDDDDNDDAKIYDKVFSCRAAAQKRIEKLFYRSSWKFSGHQFSFLHSRANSVTRWLDYLSLFGYLQQLKFAQYF